MFKEFKFNYPLTKDILYSKYGNIKEEMEKKSINILIKKRKSHYLSKYKDYLIYDYLFDFIQIKYPLKDSLDKISILAKYYKNYLSFFCRPFFTNFYYNKLLDNYFDNKAENFYKETFGKNSKDYKKKKNYLNNIIIFDEKAIKTIENPTQSTLNLNTINNELNTQRLLEEDFLTSKTLKEGINDIINTMDKKNRKKENKTIEHNDSRKNSKLGLFTIYKKNNKVNSEREKYFIGIRDYSPNNEEKSSLNQFTKLKPNKNKNIITQKNSFNCNPLSYVKNYSKNSLKISYNKNINISNIILESKKKGIIHSKKNSIQSFSSKDKKQINTNSNMISTYINNCLNFHKSIKKNKSVNNYKNNSFKYLSEKNILSTRIKEDNKNFQPLNINNISNCPKKNNINLKKKKAFNHSLENLKNIKSIQNSTLNVEGNNNKKKKNLNLNVHPNNINIDVNGGNITSNNFFRNKSVSNFFKKSRNKNNEKGKIINNELDKIVEKIINKNHLNKKLKFNSSNHLDLVLRSMKKMKNNNNNQTYKHIRHNSKKGENTIFSCRDDSTKKKKLYFGPINN